MKNMKNKRICWITAPYMLQVDLPILSTLSKNYGIDWFVWGSSVSDNAGLAKTYAEKNDIPLRFIESPYSFYNPMSLIFCCKILRTLNMNGYDAYYLDISTFPWLLYAIRKYLPANKVILAMHHGKIHSGMRFKPIYRPFLKYLNRQPFFLQYFSKLQADAFRGKDNSKKYIIPLALNDFGSPDAMPDTEKVVFTAFGNIIESKNIPLLIEAGNRLWEEYPEKFVIRIAGKGRLWNTCKYLIRHPEAFELDIRRIPDEEIPNLFATSHYIVFPYKAVTQSGPLRIAYGYDIPVIASDLEGFKESVEENVTGVLFKSENVESLVEVMRRAISDHPSQHNRIKASQYEYVRQNLTTASVCAKYIEMLDKVLKE